MTRFALKPGYAAHVGEGLAVESNIHVLDLARAYVVLLRHLEQIPAVKSLENPLYFCETTDDNEPSWYNVAKVIGDGLHKAGKIQSPEPQELTKDKRDDVFAEHTGAVLGLNNRSGGNRLRAEKD